MHKSTDGGWIPAENVEAANQQKLREAAALRAVKETEAELAFARKRLSDVRSLKTCGTQAISDG